MPPVGAALKLGKAAISRGRKPLKWAGHGINAAFASLMLNDLLGSVGLPSLGSTGSEEEAVNQTGGRIRGQMQADELDSLFQQEQGIGDYLDSIDRSRSRYANVSNDLQAGGLGRLDQLLMDRQQAISRISQPSVPTMAEIMAAMEI